MKWPIYLILFVISLHVSAQEEGEIPPPPPTALTIGLFQGGGSLVGADIDLLLGKRFGVQGGGGYLGLGAGFLYHIGEPYKINTSALSMSYWQYGAGSNFVASYAGPSIIFRFIDLLSVQVGVGTRIAKNNDPFNATKTTPASLRLALGMFFFRN